MHVGKGRKGLACLDRVSAQLRWGYGALKVAASHCGRCSCEGGELHRWSRFLSGRLSLSGASAGLDLDSMGPRVCVRAHWECMTFTSEQQGVLASQGTRRCRQDLSSRTHKYGRIFDTDPLICTVRKFCCCSEFILVHNLLIVAPDYRTDCVPFKSAC
ncbi:unnamed protein product [Tetraodon nigroviridis]|uniref:Chromosome 11 SCAF14479, whole genome shotgun sequence n=1 Tax=Tetraodon nigroviridis TaxID=99883 RepID=Q4SS32_TETNG|nr:unnamed protein product [Tetraodon nigroviridis]